jgi:hypothetical protein
MSEPALSGARSNVTGQAHYFAPGEKMATLTAKP